MILNDKVIKMRIVSYNMFYGPAFLRFGRLL